MTVPETFETLSSTVEILEPEVAGLPGLFGPTANPQAALARMSELADSLVDVVKQKHLAVTINRKQHLTVEAWQTLGGLVGVYASIAWTRPNETEDGYVARAEARILSGDLVGAAEAECSRAEKVWSDRYPFTLRSMAQTRAISRALRAPLAQIAVLAGYEATAAEEMVELDAIVPAGPAAPVQATREQLREIAALIASLQDRAPEKDWRSWAREQAGGISALELTRGAAAVLICRLQERRP